MIESDDSVTKIMYDLGEALIADDKGDLGYFSYRNRPRHRYHGVSSPRHDSALHHWQAGVLLMLGAQFLHLSQLVNEAKEVVEDF